MTLCRYILVFILCCPYGLISILSSACPVFTYGVNCSVPCGKCKDNTTCEQSSGICDEGCASGWTGERCKDPDKYPVTTFVLSVLLGVFVVVALLIGIEWGKHILRHEKNSKRLNSYEIPADKVEPDIGQAESYQTLKGDSSELDSDGYIEPREVKTSSSPTNGSKLPLPDDKNCYMELL